jgi:hypothetical protein
MRAVTWKPGTDVFLDSLFDELREKRYSDKSHHLWKNYSKEELEVWSGSIAYTICFDDHDNPEMCSTISSRDCWPKKTYRILNRLWKNSNIINYPVIMSPSFGYTAKSQIDWLRENTSYELYFISRQKENWEKWVIRMFKQHYDLSFQTDNYKYLTCPNECDDTCWQKIIYQGNSAILNQWKRCLLKK